LPRTCEIAPYAPALRAVNSFFSILTWSAVIFVPSGMSTAAMTVSATVGGASGPVFCPPWSRRIAMNATIARNTPMSRTNRLERFK